MIIGLAIYEPYDATSTFVENLYIHQEGNPLFTQKGLRVGFPDERLCLMTISIYNRLYHHQPKYCGYVRCTYKTTVVLLLHVQKFEDNFPASSAAGNEYNVLHKLSHS